MTYYSTWILAALFVGAFIWVFSALRQRRDLHGPWGYGAYYGGPDFGVPPDWPRAGRNSSAPSSMRP